MPQTVAQFATEMADREAIRDCLYRYCRGIDRLDIELIESAYWPDASDEHGNFIARSAREFIEHAVPILKSIEMTTHFLGNVLIEIDGDRAAVESYVRAFHRMRRPDGTAYDHVSSSRFIDRMERRSDEWRIAHRIVVRDWFREFNDAFAWNEGEFPKSLDYGKQRPLDLGGRKPDDRSYEIFVSSSVTA